MVELNLDTEGTNPLQSIIHQIVFEPNIQKKLDGLGVVLNALDENMYDAIDGEEFKKYLDSIFSDRLFMRKLNYTSKISDVPELHLEYYGKDFLSNPEFNFNEHFENRVSEIRKRIRIFLGNLLKEFNKGESFEM